MPAVPDRPRIIDRMCFARDLFGRLGAPVWVNTYPHTQSSELHEHDFLEVVLVARGRADHLTIHGCQAIAGGDLIIIQPGQWHAYAAPRRLWIRNCCLSAELFSRELAWVHDDARLAPLFPARMPRDDRERRAAHQGVRVLRFTAAPFQRLSTAYDELEALCAGGGARRRGELVARVLLVLEAIAGHAELQRPAGATGDPRIAIATATMAADIARAWSVEELARRAGLSSSHLLRRFRQETGLSPIAWLARRRAERLAVALLTGARSVAELGPEVGWDDPSYCARRFRACFGLAPDAYRRRHPAAGR